MTNTQKTGAIIVEWMEKQNEIEKVLDIAEEFSNKQFKIVEAYETLYVDSGENEKVGVALDEAYNAYEKAYTRVDELKEKLQAINETINSLRKAWDCLEWLGL